MLRTTTTAALLAGAMALAGPATAATTNDAASVCMNDAIQLQERSKGATLQPSQRQNLARLIGKARDDAERGDVAACREAMRQANAALAAGQGGGSTTGTAGGTGAPKTDAEIPPAERPAAGSGMETGSKGPPTGPRPRARQNEVRAEVGDLVQSANLTDIEGAEVVGAGGEAIGEVAAVAQSTDGQQTHLVVDVGGFLGIGGRRIVRPLAEFKAGDGNLVLERADRQSVGDMPEYDETRFREVELPDVLDRN